MPRGHFDRSERKARTRTRLLDAAARVYARRGVEGATLDEVAEEAGFTKGAVYGHFGSKENLLMALMEEYLAAEIAEQVALFDREQTTWKRPVAGSDRWMAKLEDDPGDFRLIVEFWVLAQRDDALRQRYVAGLDAVRATFAGFARESAADAGLPISDAAADNCAAVMLGLSVGLGMMRTAAPASVPPRLLGAALSVFIRAIEGDDVARRAIDLAQPPEAPGGGPVAPRR